MAVAYNLVIRPGVTFNKIFKWYTKDNVTLAKVPVNLSGYTGKMEIRANIGETVLMSITTEHQPTDTGGLMTLSSLGEITLNISAANTALYTQELAVYDILLTAPNLEVFEFASGSVTLKKGVTE
jgi:hypothetical protein